MDYVNLKVDKENEFVQYNDEFHKYWTKDSNQGCISVTTLIHKFTTFDEEFWSCYKTLERLISPEDFKLVKPDLLKSKRFSYANVENFNIPIHTFEEQKGILLKEWQDKRETSCIRGNEIHKIQEMMHLSGQTKEIKTLGLGGKFKTNTSNQIIPGVKGVYPELLLSRISEDGKLRLAGQADLIIVDGVDVYVLDYKSNRSIDMKAYYDRRNKKHSTLKYPLNNIQDSNFWHYTLQLSTYAWMIQKISPEFNIKLLMLIHHDHEGNVNTYECEYRKNDVERMLAFYKKELEHEEFKKSLEKMTF